MIYKPLIPLNMRDDWKITSASISKNFKHLREIDQEQKRKGELLYRYFSLTVADGRVYYQIIKISKKTATVELCEGIDPDEYRDAILGNSSVIPINRAKELIHSRDNLEKIFPVF